MSHGHFKLVCPRCTAVLAQCRCMSVDKVIEISKAECDDCKNKDDAGSGGAGGGSDA